MQELGFLDRWHSQSVRTRHPAPRKALAARSSRCRFLAILSRHTAPFVRGVRFLPQSCPCQKHPWTKTATRSFDQMKSGRPIIDACRLQPRRPLCRRSAARRTSVLALPVLCTRAISAERDKRPKVVRCALGFPAKSTMASYGLRCSRDDLFCEGWWDGVSNHFTHHVNFVRGKPKRPRERLNRCGLSDRNSRATPIWMPKSSLGGRRAASCDRR